MTTTPPAVRAFFTAGSTRWHSRRDCPVIDTSRLLWGWTSGEESATDPLREAPAEEATAGRTPCLACASPTVTEWTVTPDNLGELLEIVDPSKVHYAPARPGSVASVEADGLTVMAHKGQPRTWARFGDTIRREHGGRYTVQHTAALEG